MSWKDILKAEFRYNSPQRWFIKTDEFASALPDELINIIGNDPTEKLAEIYENGLLVDLKNDTYYEIENGKIKSINTGNPTSFYQALSDPNVKFRKKTNKEK